MAVSGAIIPLLWAFIIECNIHASGVGKDFSSSTGFVTALIVYFGTFITDIVSVAPFITS